MIALHYRGVHERKEEEESNLCYLDCHFCDKITWDSQFIRNKVCLGSVSLQKLLSVVV